MEGWCITEPDRLKQQRIENQVVQRTVNLSAKFSSLFFPCVGWDGGSMHLCVLPEPGPVSECSPSL